MNFQVTHAELSFNMSLYPGYTLDVRWADGRVYTCNFTEKDYWSKRLLYLFNDTVHWRDDDYFSDEHYFWLREQARGLVGKKLGLKVSGTFKKLLYI